MNRDEALAELAAITQLYGLYFGSDVPQEVLDRVRQLSRIIRPDRRPDEFTPARTSSTTKLD